MKHEAYREVKVISLLFGFMHLGGYLFFSHYLTGSFIHILYITSTGLALLVMPLISERLLHIKIIKFLILFIGIIGIIKNIHTMVEALMLPNAPEPVAFIIGVVVLIVLGIMIRGIVAPKHLYYNLFKTND